MKQLTVFNALRECSMTAVLVRERLAMSANSVARALADLADRGIVGKHYLNRRDVLYYAKIGAAPPENMTGKMPGSRNCNPERARQLLLAILERKRALMPMTAAARAERERARRRRYWRARRKREADRRRSWQMAAGLLPPPPVPAERARVHSMGD